MKYLIQWLEQTVRWPVVAGIVILLFVAALLSLGQQAVYSFWGLAVLSPDYEDARGITAAIESSRDGFLPWIENPRDPWGRAFNYPRIWLEIGRIGIDQSHTSILAVIFTTAYFAGLVIFPPSRIRRLEAFLLLLGMFSPAVMLGLKAGNNDQLMFFLLAVTIVGISSSRPVWGPVGVAALLSGFVLKFFPILGIVAVTRFGRRKFLIASSSVLIFAGAYVAIHWQEMLVVRQTTPHAASVSYGKNVFWMRLASEVPALEIPAKVATWTGLILGACLFGAAWRMRNASGTAILPDGRTRTALHVGTAVYCGTFILGNNWDYRLMFLGFTIPGLTTLARGRLLVVRWVAVCTLAAVIISCWSIGVWNLLKHVPFGSQFSVVIDEFCNWMVFLGLCFLVGITFPAFRPGCLENSVILPRPESE